MKAFGNLLSIFALAFSAACGPETQTETLEPATPLVPFSEVAQPSIPLTSESLSDHLVFASDVPQTQIDTLKADLGIIDSYWDGLMSDSQRAKLEDLLGAGNSTPAQLSLWFKSRMKYILRADLATYQLGLVYGKEGRVGLQELGPTDNATDESNTGGGNIGTAIYLTTLDEQRVRSELSYIILLINDEWVPILSPRAGVMRIGPALFNPQFQVNSKQIRAFSNSVQRIEVLFHEARHSDGNSRNGSLGFPHVECPDNGQIPSELVGIPACDDTSNGAYSVGAAVLDPLASYCTRNARCTNAETSALQAIKLDRLSRVIRSGQTLKTLDPSPETGFNALNISDFGAFNLR